MATPAWRRLVVLLLLAVAVCATPAQPQGRVDEAAVKAAFLYRFTGFVEWPPADEPPEEFTVAVLGSVAVATELEKLLLRNKVHGLPSSVKRLRNPDGLSRVRMLFVGAGYSGSLREITESLRHPVLVVSESERGLDDGAAVNFLEADRRVRFEVSLPAAARVRLKIGAGMLAVAVRVRRASVDLPCNGGMPFAGMPPCALPVAQR